MYRPEEKYKQKAAFRDYTKVPVFPIILWPHFDIFKKGSERVEGLTVHTVEMQSLTLFSIGERVQRTYKEMHSRQTVEFVRGRHAAWLGFNHLEATVMEALGRVQGQEMI